LLYHGDADDIVAMDGTRRLSEALGADDVRYEELNGYKHEAHHETEERRERLYAILREWISARL
jgi:alpha-beta hydrolase superfamily lysophospholipase